MPVRPQRSVSRPRIETVLLLGAVALSLAILTFARDEKVAGAGVAVTIVATVIFARHRARRRFGRWPRVDDARFYSQYRDRFFGSDTNVSAERARLARLIGVPRDRISVHHSLRVLTESAGHLPGARDIVENDLAEEFEETRSPGSPNWSLDMTVGEYMDVILRGTVAKREG